MCEKCAELDEKIERCQRLLSSISDQLTVDRMKATLTFLPVPIPFFVCDNYVASRALAGFLDAVALLVL
jgi:hypothetical protein